MEHFIYYVVDSYFIGMCDVPQRANNYLSYHILLFPHYYLPHHLFCIYKCDVTIDVTPTMNSLILLTGLINEGSTILFPSFFIDKMHALISGFFVITK